MRFLRRLAAAVLIAVFGLQLNYASLFMAVPEGQGLRLPDHRGLHQT